MLDAEDSHERTIRFLVVLQHAIQATHVVNPGETALDFPALPTVTFVMSVLGRSPARDADMVVAKGDNRDDPSAAQFTPQGFTIITLIQSQTFGFAFTFADPNAIHRFENFALLMPVGFAHREVQRMSMPIHDQVTFEP